MARKNVFLDPGNPFPEMALHTASGETINLPGATGNAYGVVLFYRGHW